MRHATTVIIGAGHAGLAMSRCLSIRGIDHVVLERGAVGHSWRTERWDSLRLLTPNWQRRLPGLGYEGADPDGFATMAEIVGFIDRYASVIGAPLRNYTNVTSVRQHDDRYLVVTDTGSWRCRTVVIASGACNIAQIPRCAAATLPEVKTLGPLHYKNPEQLDLGGVLVVGASATGIQLASEIHRSGRPVVLAVGEHIRTPRSYRGKDIQWWMNATGLLDQRYDEVEDIVRARRLPSFQLVGSKNQAILDLNALRTMGIRIVGRLAGVAAGRLQFSGSLHNHCALSDLKMGRLLETFDRWAASNGMDGELAAPHRFAPTKVDETPPVSLDLTRSGIRTVIWATGFRPDYRWLHLPVFDRKGAIRHDGGVVDLPGVYLMGMQFLRRRKSALIDGAGDDAVELSDHLVTYLAGQSGMTCRSSASDRPIHRQPIRPRAWMSDL